MKIVCDFLLHNLIVQIVQFFVKIGNQLIWKQIALAKQDNVLQCVSINMVDRVILKSSI